MTRTDLNEEAITMPNPFNAGEITAVSYDLAVFQALNVFETPLKYILEVIVVGNVMNIAALLNT